MSGPAAAPRPRVPLPELLARARTVRDDAHGRRVTFSPKVFIPLTMLCRDRCGYCTFAQPPARLESPYLTPEQVLAIATAGAAAGCHEALFTLGEAPEDRYPLAARLARRARLRLDGRLPRRHGPARARRDRAAPPRQRRRARPRPTSPPCGPSRPSQGMMVESLRDDLDCHRGAPDKVPGPPPRHARGRRASWRSRSPPASSSASARTVADRDRGARGHRRLAPPPRPRAGGDRPELPAQAGHGDARRRRRARRTTSSRPSPWPG